MTMGDGPYKSYDPKNPLGRQSDPWPESEGGPPRRVPPTLLNRIFALGPDEQRLLLDLLDRIELGRERYGEWNPQNETRDFQKEKREEVLDLLVYDAMERVMAHSGLLNEGGYTRAFVKYHKARLRGERVTP